DCCSFQERIIPPLGADRCGWSMSCYHKSVVIECHQLSLDGTDDFFVRTAPKIGSADTLHEESVTGKQNVAIPRQVKGCAARRVSRSVQNTEFDAMARNRIAVPNEAVDHSGIRCRQAAKLRLHIEVFEQGQVRFVNR